MSPGADHAQEGPMTAPGLSIEPAAALPIEQLAAVWNRAYEGYFVPLVFDVDMMARHLHRADVGLALSRVLRRDGELVGVSLAARRGTRGYIAGFGIAAAVRRQGLAGLLIGAHLRALADAGLNAVQLEVIEQNPAREVYRQAGFVETRMLALLEGPLDAPSEAPAPPAAFLAGPQLQAVHVRTHAGVSPTWRRDWPTLAEDLARGAFEALGVGEPAQAHACVQAAGERATLVDAAAVDEAAGACLLDALAVQWPGRHWRLVDEPVDSPLYRAAVARGLRVALRQVEMVATLR